MPKCTKVCPHCKQEFITSRPDRQVYCTSDCYNNYRNLFLIRDENGFKKCSKCLVWQPESNFNVRASAKDKLRPDCKNCQKSHNKDYYVAHAEHRREYSKQWSEKNQEHVKAYRARFKKSRNASSRAYYRKNHEVCKLRARNWQKKNPEKASANRANRRARELSAEGSFTDNDIKDIYKAQGGKCWYCGADISTKYHIDHYIPLSKGGSNNPNNLRLACAFCNLSKGDKMPYEWHGNNGLLL